MQVGVLEERFTILRWGVIAGGVILVPLANFAYRSGTLTRGQCNVATLLGAGLVLWGVMMKSLRIEIDPVTRQISYENRSLLHTAREMLTFEQIEDVIVRVNRDVSEGSHRAHEEYRLFLLMGSRQLPLSRTHTIDLRDCERRASEILVLLGLEKQGSLLERSLQHAAVNKHRIEAIRLARRLYGGSLADADARVRALEVQPGDVSPERPTTWKPLP